MQAVMALGVWLAKIADPATNVLTTKASATILTVNLFSPWLLRDSGVATSMRFAAEI
jgi:hypothetical protein